jgi:hypothetical protein
MNADAHTNAANMNADDGSVEAEGRRSSSGDEVCRKNSSGVAGAI